MQHDSLAKVPRTYSMPWVSYLCMYHLSILVLYTLLFTCATLALLFFTCSFISAFDIPGNWARSLGERGKDANDERQRQGEKVSVVLLFYWTCFWSLAV
jgi:hypothetical protein